MEIICYIGPSGTGKSRAAREAYPQAYWGPKGKWWDGYCGQETVIVDEMYGHRFSFSELLQLLDRYPFQVETKGGVRQFTSRRIVFTSNQDPQDWYNAERTHQMRWAENPLYRRLREYGRIIYTGEVHRATPPLARTEERGPTQVGAAPGDCNHSLYDSMSGQIIPALDIVDTRNWKILDID